jgi:hypothetical protein
MTGCMIINSYDRLLADLSPPSYTPLQRLIKAFELRTGTSFNDVIKKSGKHDYTILRGLLCYILRYYYGYSYKSLCCLTGYTSNQPIFRINDLFQSELTINPNLRRDYEAIKAMLSIS